MLQEKIVVDWYSELSIDNAEKEKERLENDGYHFLETKDSFRTTILIFEKEEED